MHHRNPSKHSTWPLWWFARLEAAIKAGDLAGVKRARQKLEELGVEVRFTLPHRSWDGRHG